MKVQSCWMNVSFDNPKTYSLENNAIKYNEILKGVEQYENSLSTVKEFKYF